MKQALWALALLASSAFGADFTGKFNGTVVLIENGENHEHSAIVELKQDGDTVTGSGGPEQDKMLPISNVKVDGNKIHFTINPDDEDPWVFDLVLEGDHLTGSITGGASSDGKKAKLDVTRSH